MTTENNLTAQQEQFITMLISGETISSIATELGVNRSTLYAWRELETVTARYNQLLRDLKADLETGINGLHSKAVQAIKDCLESTNDQTRFKAALYVIERVEKLEPGITDPEQIVRGRFTTQVDPFQADLEALTGKPELDQAGYRQRMKELGLAS